MCHDRWRTVTRWSALPLLAWLYLSTALPGCSPAGQTSGRPGGTSNRLVKMRSLRGTGDPRRPGERPNPASRKSGHQ